MRVYIIRGLPGSGKSTLAKIIAAAEERVHGQAKVGIYNTDQYFINEEGEYRFDPSKLSEYHLRNLTAFIQDLGDKTVLIVDNTNTQRWEYEKYVAAAEAAGYEVQFITVGQPKSKSHIRKCAKRNVHLCPVEAIIRMSQRFEP